MKSKPTLLHVTSHKVIDFNIEIAFRIQVEARVKTVHKI